MSNRKKYETPPRPDGLQTFDEYITYETEICKGELEWDLAVLRHPHIRHTNWMDWKSEIRQIMNSEEFKQKAMSVLQQNERYQKLTSDTVGSDPDILKEYQKYRSETLAKLQEETLQNKTKAFMSYLVEKQDLLIDLADDIASDIMNDVRDDLKTEKQYVITHDCSHGYNGWYYDHHTVKQDLTPDNIENFIWDLDDQIEDAKESALGDIDLIQEIMDWLSKHDAERFQIEMAKVSEGIDEYQDEWFYETLSDQIYWHGLENDLQRFSDALQFNDEYSSLESDEVYSLVEQNPYYKPYIEQQKREEAESEAMKQDILERIPDSPVDLYPAARAMHRRFVLHIGPTNSGKTFHALEALKAAGNGVYLAPLRLLAYECYERLNADGVPCSMVTGEEERITDGAKHTASTVELLDLSAHYNIAVIDEAQMIADKQRGSGWTEAILGVNADEIHVCAAPEAKDLIVKLIGMCHDTYEIRTYERMVPLEPDTEAFTFTKSVKPGDALIVFSKAKVLAVAAELQKNHIPCSVIYGSLPYESRIAEVQKFISGQTKAVVATDAIGMGMNLPIRRIVFLEMTKYDGTDQRQLYPAEARQIAGRAGRKGIFDIGTYTCPYNLKLATRLVNARPADITEAVLGLPKRLIRVEGKLSDIIRRWQELPDNPGFCKADMADQLELCLELEAYTDNKNLIYDFIMIPFDIKNAELRSTWLSAFQAVKDGFELPFEEPYYDISDLETLEQAYKYCDLMYYYHRRFCRKSQLAEITEAKQAITAAITKLLSKQALKGKKCRECGCPLPWNYPYPMCDSCHSMLYPPRRHSYYGWDDDDYDDDDEEW